MPIWLPGPKPGFCCVMVLCHAKALGAMTSPAASDLVPWGPLHCIVAAKEHALQMAAWFWQTLRFLILRHLIASANKMPLLLHGL